MVDAVFERLAVGIDHFSDFATKFFLALGWFQTLHLIFAHSSVDAGRVKNLIGIISRVLVFVELQPEVTQGLGRLIDISDVFAAIEAQVVHIQGTLDVVITALLPVLRAGRAVDVAVIVGIGKQVGDLFKFVAVVRNGLGKKAQTPQQKAKANPAALDGGLLKHKQWF